VRPFDPRLAGEIKPIRGAIGFTVLLAFISAAALVVQAIFTASAISDAFLLHSAISAVLPLVGIAAAAWFVRTLVTSANEALSRKYGLKAVSETRVKSISKILQIQNLPIPSGSAVSLLTRGIDGIEIYVARYLPQLVISAVVPLGIGCVILALDPTAALVLVITIPLIPLFMALVGWFTSANVEKHWNQVTKLVATIADLMNGLPELTIFNRAKQQADEIERIGKLQQEATMKVLKISFLSAFVLELLATISVAIVAVAIGLRLVNGEVELWKGLAVLILAPDVYAPLRMLGVHFHAAVEGMEAWNQVTKILDSELVQRGNIEKTINTVSWSRQLIQLGDGRIQIPEGEVKAGEITVVVGPSGIGKTTLLRAICGEVPSDCSANELSQFSFATNFALVPQNPYLVEGSLREVLLFGLEREVDDDELVESLHNVGLELSLDHRISDRSQGVSIGQRRRIAIAHALLRKPNILLLDEPSAALDELSEQKIIDAVRSFTKDGGAVLAVAHRENFVQIADSIIEFGGAK
jgi:thiol reductant ABC exporter CydD subunit